MPCNALLVASLRPQHPHRPHLWRPLLQVTIGLCQVATVTQPIVLALKRVDSVNNNPIGLDLKTVQLPVANNEVPACFGGAYKTIAFPQQLSAGFNYALLVRGTTSSAQFGWLSQSATPTPPRYYVGYRFSNDAGTNWYPYSGYDSAIRIEFACGT